ncbi:MAG TPA: hypothetical protein VMU89_18985 [Thermomicrobiaceae bacterium]|nr:hypothetical protein [Thermomicrobiaceae bacterium]
MRATRLASRSAVMALLLVIALAAACGGVASPAVVATATTTGVEATSAVSSAPTATAAPTAVPSPTSPPATTVPTPIATAGGATSPASPATGTVSVAALVAIGEQLFPATPDGAAYIECSNGGNVYANCPITDRLQQRLQQAMVTLCRCQNPAQTRTVAADATATGGVIHVSLGSQRFDLVAVQVGGRLLVDDQRCQGGGASTSIYSDIAPC